MNTQSSASSSSANTKVKGAKLTQQPAVIFANHLEVGDEDANQYTFGFFDEQQASNVVQQVATTSTCTSSNNSTSRLTSNNSTTTLSSATGTATNTLVTPFTTTTPSTPHNGSISLSSDTATTNGNSKCSNSSQVNSNRKQPTQHRIQLQEQSKLSKQKQSKTSLNSENYKFIDNIDANSFNYHQILKFISSSWENTKAHMAAQNH